MAHLHNIIKGMRQNFYLHKLDATSRKIWQKKGKILFPECPEFLEDSFYSLFSNRAVLHDCVFPDLFSTDRKWHQQELGIIWQTASFQRMLTHAPLLTSQLAVKTWKGNSKGLQRAHWVVVVHGEHVLSHAAKLHHNVVSCKKGHKNNAFSLFICSPY